MRNLTDSILKRVPIRHIWIFVTDKCNLDCDYCFFKGKKGIYLSFGALSNLLAGFTPGKHDFVLSGGEPLLCWQLTKKIIKHIRCSFPASEITLQTNLFYLTAKKILTLKEHNTVIEPGLDGDFFSNFKHRRGFNSANFNSILSKIGLVVTSGLAMNPTMTVHPDETGNMLENFNKLISLGLVSIDVHPAFLEKWDAKAEKDFLSQYRQILKLEKKAKKNLLCKNYSIFIRPSIDLIIQPDGLVLPNWTALSFPEKAKKELYLMRLKDDGIDLFTENAARYFKHFAIFSKNRHTYRDFSNFNAALSLNFLKDRALKARFASYARLCEKIQRLDQIFLKEVV